MPVFYDETNPKNFQVDEIFTIGDPEIIMLLIFSNFLLLMKTFFPSKDGV
jgi:hypothetical protein